MPIEKLSCSLHDDAETVVASTANGPAAPPISPNEVVIESADRVFTRDSLRGY